MLPSEISWSVC